LICGKLWKQGMVQHLFSALADEIFTGKSTQRSSRHLPIFTQYLQMKFSQELWLVK